MVMAGSFQNPLPVFQNTNEDPKDKKIRELQDQLRQLQQNNKQQETELFLAKNHVQSQDREIRELQGQLGQLQQNIKRHETELFLANNYLQAKDREISGLNATCAHLQAYSAQQKEYFEALLKNLSDQKQVTDTEYTNLLQWVSIRNATTFP